MHDEVQRKVQNLKRKSITVQLILNVIVPVIIALTALATSHYLHTKGILTDFNQTKNRIITDEIRHILELQDVSFSAVEEMLDDHLRRLSDTLTNVIFKDTENIKETNLDSVRQILNMKPDMEDIYIINRRGFIINTTFAKDLNLNFFSFGEKHKQYILGIFDNMKFLSERFAIESSTKRIKKYTYQPTRDGKYIVELGSYSEKADRIVKIFNQTLDSISHSEESIVSVDFFIEARTPFSINKDIKLDIDQLQTIQKAFDDKKTIETKEIINGKEMAVQYIHIKRKNTNLYKNAVIRIISDNSRENYFLRIELLKSGLVFGITLLVLFILIYNKTSAITKPIKTLVDSVIQITNGDFKKRVEVLGNNEISILTEQFNTMVSTIEGYTNDLEEKVRERTKEILKQKEQITDSIVYASRIQSAVLPPQELIEKEFSEHFVLYKPRNIVSGDLYWMARKDDEMIVAVADCTGHGVPGAFMSMLGIAFLNQIVMKTEGIQSNEILTNLRENVMSSLRQTGKQGESRDGMDIALCIIYFKKMKLQFSGAYNPLCLIRNDELIEAKGDKMPIGIHHKTPKPFTNHEMDIQYGDTIYLFTDGYSDQFGGINNVKFQYKTFKELLLKIHNLSMTQQRAVLDKTIEEWKGNLKQIDDILVVGFKI